MVIRDLKILIIYIITLIRELKTLKWINRKYGID
jgi:hypothetical protein